MPEMDGYTATGLIRADPRFATLPVIAMTAHAMAGDHEKSAAAGMNDHVTKPIDPDRLFETLAKWIAVPKPRVAESRRAPAAASTRASTAQLLPADAGRVRAGGGAAAAGRQPEASTASCSRTSPRATPTAPPEIRAGARRRRVRRGRGAWRTTSRDSPETSRRRAAAAAGRDREAGQGGEPRAPAGAGGAAGGRRRRSNGARAGAAGGAVARPSRKRPARAPLRRKRSRRRGCRASSRRRRRGDCARPPSSAMSRRWRRSRATSPRAARSSRRTRTGSPASPTISISKASSRSPATWKGGRNELRTGRSTAGTVECDVPGEGRVMTTETKATRDELAAGATLLLVDDNVTNLQVLRETVEGLGARILVAKSGARARHRREDPARPDPARHHDAGDGRLRGLPAAQGGRGHAADPGPLPDRPRRPGGRGAGALARRGGLHRQADPSRSGARAGAESPGAEPLPEPPRGGGAAADAGAAAHPGGDDRGPGDARRVARPRDGRPHQAHPELRQGAGGEAQEPSGVLGASSTTRRSSCSISRRRSTTSARWGCATPSC